MTDKPFSDDALRERLAGLIDAYGADPSHWPQDVRASADALLQSSPAARRVLAEAQAVEAMIAAPQSVTDTARLDALQARVMASVGAQAPAAPRVVSLADVRQERTSSMSPAPRSVGLLNWRAGVALAASLVLGILTGLSDGPGPLGAESFAALVSGSNDEVAINDDAVTADVEDYL